VAVPDREESGGCSRAMAAEEEEVGVRIVEQQRWRRGARVVEWRRRRPAQVASMAVLETDGVESARWGLREFWDEKQNDTGQATIYWFKPINSGS
jgi:hypothetical protein